MRAALRFVGGLREHGMLSGAARSRLVLFGPLGATGHGSDTAVLPGRRDAGADTKTRYSQTVRGGPAVDASER